MEIRQQSPNLFTARLHISQMNARADYLCVISGIGPTAEDAKIDCRRQIHMLIMEMCTAALKEDDIT